MIRLDGCKPTSLASYMKGMGVFRVTAEQKDSDVRAFWERDRLVLETNYSRDELVDFLLSKYEPSPVISPWSYGTYVKRVDLDEPIRGLPRMGRYTAAVKSTERVLLAFHESEGLDGEITKEDISGEAKTRFLRLCRNMWPDSAVEWLDAAAVMMPGKPSFHPMFGTGGNDGHFDMSINFITRLRMVFADKPSASRGWLEAALFGGDAALAKLTTSGHDPRGSGRPNSGSRYTGRDVSNPWEYILMLEGMLMFGGGISRRTGQRAGWSTFPFVVDSTQAGYATAADEKDHGEIWLPLWGRPASYGETRLVLREGRASYGNKRVRTGADFALAASRLGVARGLEGFRRFGVLERKGKAYLSVDMGQVSVGDVPQAGLVRDIWTWYEQILSFTRGGKAPQSLKMAVRELEGRVIDLCGNPGPRAVQSLLVGLGRLERMVSARTWSRRSGVVPFPGWLSADWLDAANDGTAEFRLAAATASIQKADDVGYVRENLERVKLVDGRWVAVPVSGSCVWREGATLADNLGRICIRRTIEGKAAELGAPPLGGWFPAPLGDVETFLVGVLDEAKITDLLLPLSMIRVGDTGDDAGMGTQIPVPAAYALMKAVYDTPSVSPGAAPLKLLEAGRPADALGQAWSRARASGMLDGLAVPNDPPASVAGRLLGSIVFPVGRGRKALLEAAMLREPARVVE